MPHRAIVVDEILREVTAQVTETHPPTAVALACCAKFLEEPTLSALWKFQNFIPALIKTLPPDSWELHFGGVEDTIVRNLPQLRWFRFTQGLRTKAAGFWFRRSPVTRRRRNGPGF